MQRRGCEHVPGGQAADELSQSFERDADPPVLCEHSAEKPHAGGDPGKKCDEEGKVPDGEGPLLHLRCHHQQGDARRDMDHVCVYSLQQLGEQGVAESGSPPFFVECLEAPQDRLLRVGHLHCLDGAEEFRDESGNPAGCLPPLPAVVPDPVAHSLDHDHDQNHGDQDDAGNGRRDGEHEAKRRQGKQQHPHEISPEFQVGDQFPGVPAQSADRLARRSRERSHAGSSHNPVDAVAANQGIEHQVDREPDPVPGGHHAHMPDSQPDQDRQ